MFTDQHIADAQKHPNLGPAYFCSRDVVERAMESVQSNDFKPLIDGIVKQIQDHVWQGVQDHLLSDTEMNLQGAMWHQVDEIVKRLLSGEDWAIKKYALAERYDCATIRATLAALIPKELQDARVSDLEAELANAKKDIEFYRRTRG